MAQNKCDCDSCFAVYVAKSRISEKIFQALVDMALWLGSNRSAFAFQPPRLSSLATVGKFIALSLIVSI